MKNTRKKSLAANCEEKDFDSNLKEFCGMRICPDLEVRDGDDEHDKENREEDSKESAAARKKKKRKEKEKAKKAAASVGMSDSNAKEGGSKISQKKVPLGVRKILEEQARRREAEERKKREEEEKRRKEEEEMMRIEKVERLKEEERRRKKVHEKEKRLKKKQEGKLLTVKQKETKLKNDAWLNQILAKEGVAIPPANTVTKRPVYERKKSKPVLMQPSNDGIGIENVVEGSVSGISDDAAEIEYQLVAKEWESKNWDDVNISLTNSTCCKAEEDALGASESSKHMKVLTTKPEIQELNVAGDVSEKSPKSLRSPICCVLGHVDSGKTKLLDCIRGTNVQITEAGFITQQIGATLIPVENIRERTKELKENAKLLVPGLLMIDTPGHESFTNLRSRGSGLCDIAILVVDIMHGLEPQTIESINLLKMRNTEFIIALNKVDRLYGWKPFKDAPITKSMKLQSADVKNEFQWRCSGIIEQFKEQGLNTKLYYKNREMGQTYSIVPTSAVTGEGIPDLLLLLLQYTQKTMETKLLFTNEVNCSVLEVKEDQGHGKTIDVILVNGVLHVGDQIVVCGIQGPIVTTIRVLLTPHPMKELRIKGNFCSNRQVEATQGVKISAAGLDHAIAGTGLNVVKPTDSLEAIKDAAMQDVKTVMNRIETSKRGVYIQASSLGSLEALSELLKSPAVNIPVSKSSIGPVHRYDVIRASSMVEKCEEYATILAFDVEVTNEALLLAQETGVKIFSATVIYRLLDKFKAYVDKLKQERKKEAVKEAIFPCVLKIRPDGIFRKKNPLVLGVDVLEGIVKVGTPICVPSRDYIDIGQIASIEVNGKQVEVAKKGQKKVGIKIVNSNPEEQHKIYGRHFDLDDELVSHITRRSMDVLTAYLPEDLSAEELKLAEKLKKIFIYSRKYF